ncbi:MAG: acetyl-CoA carboxylase carboxyltransferase subunit beta [Ktedonobacterales bacterium]|nr:acetyl-CoA carboxylase carboxyltransferase subunit beta [Ktedonobacterales bacterium]
MHQPETNGNGTFNGAASGATKLAPANVATRCEKCRKMLFTRDLEKTQKICPECGYHFRLTAEERVESLVDDYGAFQWMDDDLRSADPLHFSSRNVAYAEKLDEARAKTGISESVIAGMGAIGTHRVSLAVMDFRFIGGSMGTVAGERLTRAIERGAEGRCPVIIFSASGGARMQESLFSLFQMAKTSAALTRLRTVQQPFISVLTDPTTGGVTASYAMLGDVIIAEPGALIGFAGPIVIEQSIHQKLPPDTDTSEFALAHGMIDMIVDRRSMKVTLTHLLKLYAGKR